ncbi:MAG: ATP synthase F1 subunit gamma [candidate division Zixibacteria bacterium]|nr:ATP synthase F1 subunit gamma [candidate division Zixibacteria bacterium]
MATLRDLRRRIKTVQGTQQITRAMEMVAAARLGRAQAKVESSRPYASKMQAMLGNLTKAGASVVHPLFEKREMKKVGLVVITSDRGLCGSYNHNVIHEADKFIGRYKTDQVVLILVGTKGNTYYARRACEIRSKYVGLGAELKLAQVKNITNDLVNLFLSREVDEIHFTYTKFLSPVSYRVTSEKFLNIESQVETEDRDALVDYIFEPNPQKIFASLLPNYCITRVQMALAESFASEHGSRMIAMGAATKNAEEMIDHLTLVMNKLRQATITKEMLEITTGAEALKG